MAERTLIELEILAMVDNHDGIKFEDLVEEVILSLECEYKEVTRDIRYLVEIGLLEIMSNDSVKSLC